MFRKSGVDRQYAQDKLRELGDGAAEVIVGRGGTVLVCGSVRERLNDCFSKKKYTTYIGEEQKGRNRQFVLLSKKQPKVK